MKKIDLSHIIEDGMTTYKGLPAPIICDYFDREESRKFYGNGESFQISKFEMVANTGTYLDCPFHRYASGDDLSQVHLDQLTDLEGILVNARDHVEIGIDFFSSLDVRDTAVLVYTDWAKHWRTDLYFEHHPYLTAEAADFLMESGAKLVGIDSYNIDNTHTHTRPVHSILLGANILIVEHLCGLDQLVGQNFLFHAAPPRIRGAGSFPVRAYASIH